MIGPPPTARAADVEDGRSALDAGIDHGVVTIAANGDVALGRSNVDGSFDAIRPGGKIDDIILGGLIHGGLYFLMRIGCASFVSVVRGLGDIDEMRAPCRN